MAKEKKTNRQGEGGGRPKKLSDKIIRILKKLLKNEKNVKYCTDEELILLINEKLNDKEKISIDTWKRWKKGDFKRDDEQLDIWGETEESIYQKFCTLTALALIEQKHALFENLEAADRTWSKWAWIIERKFTDWNLRQIIESTEDVLLKTNEDLDQNKKEQLNQLLEDYEKKTTSNNT